MSIVIASFIAMNSAIIGVTNMSRTEFEQLNTQPSNSIVKEFWQFIMENKAWWMIPIMAVLGIFGVLIVLAGTGLAPFIYPFF
jgi:hypothetical protein